MQTIENYTYIGLSILAGAIGGFFIEKLILKVFKLYALKTKWKFDDIFVEALSGVLTAWFVVISYSASIRYFQVSDRFKNISDKISASVIILSLTILIGRILIKLIKSKTSDLSGHTASTSIILNILKVSIFLIGAMLILQVFGISITPMLTALGVGGLAVALALQETLSNLFSGIQLIATKNIRNGDYIKLESGEKGYVVDITWRNTIIKELPNNLIVVPNSKLSSAIIINYSLPEPELAVLVELGVSYDSDLEFVEKLSIETAKEVLKSTDGGIKSFEPLVRFHTFADSSINFTVILRANGFENQFLIKSEFVKALQKAFNENKIEIPFPQRTLSFKNADSNPELRPPKT